MLDQMFDTASNMFQLHPTSWVVIKHGGQTIKCWFTQHVGSSNIYRYYKLWSSKFWKQFLKLRIEAWKIQERGLKPWPRDESWTFQASIRNFKNCVHNFDYHSLLDFTSADQCMKYFIYHFSFIPHGLIRIHKWPTPIFSGFIAQLITALHRYREITGSNPVEILAFLASYIQLYKMRSWLRAKKLIRYQRQILILWEQYANRERTCKDYLRRALSLEALSTCRSLALSAVFFPVLKITSIFRSPTQHYLILNLKSN